MSNATIVTLYVLEVGNGKLQCNSTYRKPLFRVDFYHAPEQILTIGRHKMGYVKVSSFDFFQQLSEIVIIKRQSSDKQGIKYDTTRPDVSSSSIIFLTLHNLKRTNSLFSKCTRRESLKIRTSSFKTFKLGGEEFSLKCTFILKMI